MKTHFNTLLISALLFFSCNSSSDKVADFIPGTYVLHSEGEYSKAQDTLIINQSNGTVYNIKRHTSFQRKGNGKLFSTQYKQEIWAGTYDKKSQSIHESRRGKILVFMPNSNSLLLGTAEYLKIK